MKTKLLQLLMFIAVLSNELQVFAHDFKYNSIYYNILSESDKTVEVTYKGSLYDEYINEYNGDVIIPESAIYNGIIYSVVKIGEKTFRKCTDLISVTIPKSVSLIGDYAFFDCIGLTSIIVEDGNIVYNSYGNCNAIIETETNTLITGCKSTVIPDFVKNIASFAFAGCIDLTNIMLPDSIINIGSSAFFGCKDLKKITMGNSVVNIGNSSFAGCESLTSITIPSSVKCIGSGAFSGCSGLKTIIMLSQKPPMCYKKPFYGLNISEILLSVPNEYEFEYKQAMTWKEFRYKGDILSFNVLNNTEVEVVANEKKYSGDIIIPSECIIDGKKYTVTRIAEKAFSNCSKLTSITIPYSIIEIGNRAFYNCNRLKAVYFNAENCTKMGTKTCPVFSNCNAIEIITIGDKVRTIPANAFADCTGLTNITIPNSVTNIDDCVFSGCYGLNNITLLNQLPPTCYGNPFNGLNTHEIMLTIPTESLFEYKQAMTWKEFRYKGDILSFNVLNNTEVEVVANEKKYSGDIIIPGECIIDGKKYTVTRIAERAFYNCIELNSIIIPNSIIRIGNYAFSNCCKLKNVTIPISIIEIGNRAFWRCNELNEVRFNAENCTKMGTKTFPVFDNCNAFEKLIIGDNVKTIPANAFRNCRGLMSVTSLNTLPPICDSSSFYNVKVSNLTLSVKSLSVIDYKSTNVWKDFGDITGL